MTDITPGEPKRQYAARRGTIPTWAYRRLKGHERYYELLAFYIDLSIYVAGWDAHGWKRQEELVEITGLSLATIKRRVSDLKGLGVIVIRRKPMANGHMGPNHYYLLDDDPELLPAEEPAHHSSPRVSPGGSGPQLTQGELAPQLTQGEPSYVNTTTKPKNNGDSLRSSPATASLAAEQPPLIPDEVLDGVIVDDRPLPAIRETRAVAVNAGVLVGAFAGWCERELAVKIPDNHIKRFGKAVKEAADQGFPEDIIKRALASMARDRLFDRPELLKNHLVRVQAGPSLPPERLSRVQADRLRQAGETPQETASAVAAFLAIPDPRKASTP